MSDVGHLFKQRFTEFVDGEYRTAFFDRDWFSPDSISYRANLRPWLNVRGLNLYEFESSTLDSDILSAKILAGDVSQSSSTFSFRFLCEHIEHSPASVIAIYRCSELSSKTVQLLSRLSRYFESSGSGWKLIYFGSASQVYPLNLKLLAPQVTVSFPVGGSALVEKSPFAVNLRPLVVARVALGIISIVVVGLLFSGTFEQDEANSGDGQTVNSVVSLEAISVSGDAGAVANTNAVSERFTPQQAEKEMQEWTQHVAEFDEVMMRYSASPITPSKLETSEEKTKETIEPVAKNASLITADRKSKWSNPTGLKMSKGMWQAANKGNAIEFAAALPSKHAINATSENSETALIIASVKGYYDLVSWLLENAAEANLEDSDQRTALYYAAVNGHYDIAQMLLSQGANTAHLSKLSKTPLMAAVHNRYHKLARLLIQAGSDVNQQDHSGWSALFYAVWNGDEKIASLLIDAGAQLSAQDKDGYTVKDIANAKKNRDILELLAKS